MTAPEIIQGHEGPPLGGRLRGWAARHRLLAGLGVVATVGLLAGGAVVVATRPPQAPLRLAEAAAVDDIGVTPGPEDGGAPGALGVPAGAAIPGSVVVLYLDNVGTVDATAEVVGRTGPAVRIVALPSGAPGTGGGGPIAPGGSGSLRVAVSPVDCARTPSADELAAAAEGLVVMRSTGSDPPVVVPVVADVVDTLRRVWARSCAALPSPSIVAATASTAPGTAADGAVTSARLSVDIDRTRPVDVDRIDLVVTPLDDDRRSGLGAATRRGPGPVEVVWVDDPPPGADASPGAAAAGPPARVQVFVVDGATALPFLLDAPLDPRHAGG